MKNESDFLKTKLNLGLVVKGTLDEIEELKQFIEQQGFFVVYQTVSANRLWVVEKQ